MSFTVAIDGPAASGKGTIGRALAARFGFAHLDTGLLYRAVAARVLDGMTPEDAAMTLAPEHVTRPDLRAPDVGQMASKVAVLAEVRAALLDYQRAFARRAGGAVLDGRDIGTVVCPEAEVKLFVTAADTVRARRRHAEIVAGGGEVSYAQVLDDLRARDERDARRALAPLDAAADALLLDTTELSIEAAVEQAAQAVEDRMRQGRV